MFSPLKPAVLQDRPVVFIIDQNSFWLPEATDERNRLLNSLGGGRIRATDLRREIEARKEDDLYFDVHK